MAQTMNAIWLEEITRAMTTLEVIKHFVADSPKKRAWEESTERALARMVAWQRQEQEEKRGGGIYATK